MNDGQLTARISDVKRFAVHDGDGIRNTVFFMGCPLRCIWCHNPENLRAEKQLMLFGEKCIGCRTCCTVCSAEVHRWEGGLHLLSREKCVSCGRCGQFCPAGAVRVAGRDVTAEELLPQLCADKPFYDRSGGGVTLSGGECLLQPEFCAELLRLLREQGIGTAVDTCGDVPRENLKRVMPYTDVFLYDVKAADPLLHKKLCGRNNERILGNLRYLVRSGADIEVRIPLVVGCNDGEISAIAALLQKTGGIRRVRVLAYHDLSRSRYQALGLCDPMPLQRTGKEDVYRAAELLRRAGLDAVTGYD